MALDLAERRVTASAAEALALEYGEFLTWHFDSSERERRRHQARRDALSSGSGSTM